MCIIINNNHYTGLVTMQLFLFYFLNIKVEIKTIYDNKIYIYNIIFVWIKMFLLEKNISMLLMFVPYL